MSEEKKHPSLELMLPEVQRSKLYQNGDVARLEEQHKQNEAEKQRWIELKQILETDESDLSELRRQVLELIKQRLLKK